MSDLAATNCGGGCAFLQQRRWFYRQWRRLWLWQQLRLAVVDLIVELLLRQRQRDFGRKQPLRRRMRLRMLT